MNIISKTTSLIGNFVSSHIALSVSPLAIAPSMIGLDAEIYLAFNIIISSILTILISKN
jgi:hypothetical protein